VITYFKRKRKRRSAFFWGMVFLLLLLMYGLILLVLGICNGAPQWPSAVAVAAWR
jgi:hypothetical protein